MCGATKIDSILYGSGRVSGKGFGTGKRGGEVLILYLPYCYEFNRRKKVAYYFKKKLNYSVPADDSSPITSLT